MAPDGIDIKYVSGTTIAVWAMVITTGLAKGYFDPIRMVVVIGCLVGAFATAPRIGFSHMPLNRPLLLILPIGLALSAELLIFAGRAEHGLWMVVALSYIAGNHIAYLRQRLV